MIYLSLPFHFKRFRRIGCFLFQSDLITKIPRLLFIYALSNTNLFPTKLIESLFPVIRQLKKFEAETKLRKASK
ncbi:hypothetical protein ASF92_11675 [Pedobacter sp. Leaf176]|nr:hypothetical protein ASF92_11675 [Pedobacter sp. Leaf176]